MDNNVFVSIKLAVVGACGAFTAAYGWLGWLVVAWAVCMCLDYITGTCAACKAGKWSSKLAREGLWHKAGMFFAVIAASILDLVIGQLINNTGVQLPFDYSNFIAPIVICWYIITELGSIVENAGAMGTPVPPMLKRMIAVLSAHLDKAELPEGDDQRGNVDQS